MAHWLFFISFGFWVFYSSAWEKWYRGNGWWRDGEGNGSSWLTAVALFTFRGNSSPDVPEQRQGRERLEGEIEQKDVSDRSFSGLSPGLRSDFNESRRVGCVGPRGALSQVGKRGMEPHVRRPQVEGEKKNYREWKPQPAYLIIWCWLCPGA